MILSRDIIIFATNILLTNLNENENDEEAYF